MARASWNFLLWGLFHGTFLCTERIAEAVGWKSPSWLNPFGHIYTLVAVLLAWVLFRCESWDRAVAFYHALFGASTAAGSLGAIPVDVLTPAVCVGLGAGLIFSWPVIPALEQRLARRRTAHWGFALVTTGAELAVLCFSVLSIGAGSPNPFIYFRF